MKFDAKYFNRIFNHKWNSMLKYFQVKQFFRKKKYFLRKLQKTVLWAQLTIFKVRGSITLKTNIIFLIPNYVLVTVLLNRFSEKSVKNHLWEDR